MSNKAQKSLPETPEPQEVPETPEPQEVQKVEVNRFVEADPRQVLNPVPGRHYYWEDRENIEKGKCNDWETDHGPKNPMRVGSANPNTRLITHGSATPVGTEVTAGTMQLVWKPEEMAKQEEARYQERSDAPLRDMQDTKEAHEEFQRKLKEMGVPSNYVRTTGGITMNRRY